MCSALHQRAQASFSSLWKEITIPISENHNSGPAIIKCYVNFQLWCRTRKKMLHNLNYCGSKVGSHCIIISSVAKESFQSRIYLETSVSEFLECFLHPWAKDINSKDTRERIMPAGRSNSISLKRSLCLQEVQADTSCRKSALGKKWK